MNRNKEIKKLRDQRFTYREIGKKFNLSRERIRQIVLNINNRKNILCLTCNKKLYYKDEKKFCFKCQKINLVGRCLTRERIRIRDNHTCQICNKKWKKGRRRFDVHHKDYNKEKTRQYDSYEKEKDNLITLCHKCHLNLSEHRKSMGRNK